MMVMSASKHQNREVSRDADRSIIELHLHSLDQLFDTRDPSPFRERDLDPKADEFIVDSARELCSGQPREIALHLDQAPDHPDAQRVVSDAMRTHFARRSDFSRRELRALLRRGLISLAVGLTFLVLLFLIAQAMGLVTAESGFPTLVRESLLIIGWVAMWRPLEIFLYDWWPIVGEQRLHDRLSRIEVRIVSGDDYRIPHCH